MALVAIIAVPEGVRGVAKALSGDDACDESRPLLPVADAVGLSNGAMLLGKNPLMKSAPRRFIVGPTPSSRGVVGGCWSALIPDMENLVVLVMLWCYGKFVVGLVGSC